MKFRPLNVLALIIAGLILVLSILFWGPLTTASSYDDISAALHGPETAHAQAVAAGETPDQVGSSTPYVQKAIEKEKAVGTSSLDLWLGELIKLECRNCGPHFRRLDTNGKYSYGCLQFQAATFETYARRYGIIAAGDDFLTATIYDCSVQRRIATRMFADLGVAAAARNWFYSVYVRGLGLPRLET